MIVSVKVCFPVYGYFPVRWGLVDSDVQVVYFVVRFCFLLLNPIRHVVNQRGAPTYKLAKLFTQNIKKVAPLPNIHNVDNTRDVIKKLNDTPIPPL